MSVANGYAPFVAFCMIFAISIGSCARVPAPSLAQPGEVVVGASELTDKLQPLMGDSYKGARVYSSGDCYTEDGLEFLTFPKIKLRQVSPGKTGVDAVRDLMPDGTVVESRSGLILIALGKLPDELLNVRISELKLEDEEQVTPEMAAWAVTRNVDVVRATRALGYNLPTEDVSVIPSRPEAGKPRLPANLFDLTLDEALDRIATTFGRVVFFETCDQERLYSIDVKGR
jgi:hypothetical protein